MGMRCHTLKHMTIRRETLLDMSCISYGETPTKRA
jgi:hypothetical protein